MKLKELLRDQAFWISPSGKVNYITDGETHIGQIIKNPKFFGMNLDQIKKIYADNDEKLGIEGNAREEIILSLLKKGWIRIRKYNRPDYWSVNVSNLNNKIKDALQGWASYIIKHGAGPYSDVKIDTPHGIKRYTLSDLASDILYAREGKKIPKNRFKLKFEEKGYTVPKKWESIYHKQYSKAEYGEALYEFSLSGVWRHGKRGFFMMSAFRGNDFDKNIKNHNQLKADLKKAKLGFFEIDGVYTYDDGTTESELSVFVPYRDIYSLEDFKELSEKLGKKYNQESVLFKYPDKDENKGKAVLVYPFKKEISIGSGLGYDKISTAYSKIRKGGHAGRSFVIEGVRIPSNHISAYGLQEENILF